MMAPNTITLNEGGQNEYFFPKSNGQFSYYQIDIYDRWGKNVYNSKANTLQWDGRDNSSEKVQQGIITTLLIIILMKTT